MSNKTTLNVQDFQVVWNTDGGMGYKQNIVGIYDKPDLLSEIGPYQSQETRQGLIIGNTVYIIDNTIDPIDKNNLNVNFEKRKASIKKSALSKLTPEEKAVLGLKD